MTDNEDDKLEKKWCVVANVKKEHPYGEWGAETKSGTRQFRGGTKVYVIGHFAGSCSAVEVIGLHRHSRKTITCIVHIQHLENFRAKLIYNPSILKKVQDDTLCWIKGKEEAERLSTVFLNWQKDWKRNSELTPEGDIMGSTTNEFIKYPRTPHLFGSKGTADDKHYDEAASEAFLSDDSLIVEEKLDGTNVGIHFSPEGELFLQCRGHLITEGMHPQYDLFKQWSTVKRSLLEMMLEDRFILFGEWLYARHSVAYQKLPHYFFEFDIYDKQQQFFLTLEKRLELLEGTHIQTVPVIHKGALSRKELLKLIGPSAFAASFDNPLTGETDDLMEGLYLRTESNEKVTGRSKFVRPEFVEKIKQSTHWQHQQMVQNVLAPDVDLWS